MPRCWLCNNGADIAEVPGAAQTDALGLAIVDRVILSQDRLAKYEEFRAERLR